MFKVPLDVYELEQSSRRLRTLRQALPASDIELLAREVIDRLAAKADITAYDDPRQAHRIQLLGAALLSPDASLIVEAAAELSEEGVTLSDLYTIYLGGAARYLGELWEQDEVSFADVTLAASRIFGIVNRMRDSRPLRPVTHTQTLVVAPIPDENHTLGAQMVADLLREAGWDVMLILEPDHESLIRAVEKSDCRILAISASASLHVAALARLVVALRMSQPDLKIMIGGRIVSQEPELVDLMQPDSVANDIDFAIAELRRIEADLRQA